MVPAEALDLLEDVDFGKVSKQLADEGNVYLRIKAIFGQFVFEIAEDC